MKEIDIWDYVQNRGENDILIDIRDEGTFAFGTIPGAVNIPMSRIQELYDLPTDRDIYVFCQAGEVSGEMVELLTDNGCNAFNLTGGYRKYLRQSAREGGVKP